MESHRHHEPYPGHYPPPHSLYPPSMYTDPYGGYYGPPVVHPPPQGQIYRKEPLLPGSSADKKIEEEEEDNEPLTLVSVCRLLTAMEDYLGSLGPKCIDLLSKALALEKIKANSSDQLLSEETCVFFETVKEKFKGLLAANMVSEKKERAVKKAVQKIAGLIHTATKKTDTTKEVKEKSDFIVTNTEEFTGLISRIKSALIVQGKTDITSAQLDHLLSFFLEIARYNSQSSKTVTVNEFLMRNKNVGDENQEGAENGGSTALESLTDSDLQTLLQNFRDLSSEEQHDLISYLKKLESTDPDRVTYLRSFVGGFDDLSGVGQKQISSPINNLNKNKSKMLDLDLDEDVVDPRLANANNAGEYRKKSPEIERRFNNSVKNSNDKENSSKPTSTNMFDSDDDDDYTYDDLAKSVRQSDQFKKIDNEELIGKALSMADTQNLIANLMGSLQQSISKTTTAPENPGPVIPGLSATHFLHNQQQQPSHSLLENTHLTYYQQQQQQQHQSYDRQFQQHNLDYNSSHDNAQSSQASKAPIFPIQIPRQNPITMQPNQMHIQQKATQVQHTAYQNLNMQRGATASYVRSQPQQPQQTNQQIGQQTFYQYYRK